MAKLQLQRRRLPQRPDGFEEQSWPIYVGLLVLTGMLAGWILATCRFDFDEWWHNGWAWLAATALGVGFLAALSLLLGRNIARRYQLAAIVSLVLHTGALIALAVTTLPSREFDPPQDLRLPIAPAAQLPKANSAAQTPRANVVVNMKSGRTGAPAIDLTEQAPVETTNPDAPPAVTAEVPREQPTLQPEVAKPDQAALALVNPPATEAPKIARAAAESASVVRRADSLSMLSRNLPAQPKPDTTVAELPNLSPQQAVGEPAPAAAVREAQRQVAKSIVSNSADRGTTAPDVPQIASLTRRAEVPKADSSSAPIPMLTKKPLAPGLLPHTDDIANIAGSSPATPGAPLQPGSVQVGKQTASPFVAKPVPNVPLASTEPGRPGALPGPTNPIRNGAGEPGPLQIASTAGGSVKRNGTGKENVTTLLLLEAASVGGTNAGLSVGIDTVKGAVQRTSGSGPSTGGADFGAPGAGLKGSNAPISAMVGASAGLPGGTQPQAGSGSIQIKPSLAGGTGGGRTGKAGPASGPSIDFIAEPGLPGGKGTAGTGGDGNLAGPGPMQSAATTFARGSGSVPGNGKGAGADISGASTGVAGKVAANLNRIAGGGEGDGPPTAMNPMNISRSSGTGFGRAGAGGGSGAEIKADEPTAPAPIAGTGAGNAVGLVAVPGGAAKQLATGLPGESMNIPIGAAAGGGIVDSIFGSDPGRGVGERKNDSASGNGPQIGNLAGRTPSRRASTVTGGAAAAEPLDAPEVAGNRTGVPGGAGSAPGGSPDGLKSGMGAMGRRQLAGGVAVPVVGMTGEGGLGDQPNVVAGLPQPTAKPDATTIGPDPSRFSVTKKTAGPLALDTRVRDASAGFSGRLDNNAAGAGNGPQRGAGKSGLPGEIETRTETAIELGLKFLVRRQSQDGRWSLHNFPGATRSDAGTIQSDTAATGLALLSFLGAGYDHLEGEHKTAIQSGLRFLLKNQKSNGDLYIPQEAKSNESAWLYSHAIGTIALCEAYGMTGDEELRRPAQQALDYLVKTQNKELGGWRYEPEKGSDMSVTGWVVTAFKSGELAKLTVPAAPLQKVVAWLDKCQAAPNDAAQYVYNPLAENNVKQRHGRSPTAAMTSVALLLRLYTGWNRTNPNMIAGAERLKRTPPELGSPATSESGTYYWYYASQVMYHMGGDYWKKWNDKLHPLLVGTQARVGPLAGSWDPGGGTGDLWASYGGRIYVTTLNLLSLEVAYRHLPLYEATAK